MDEDYNTLLESQKDAIWGMNLRARATGLLVQAVTKIMTEESYAIDTRIAPEYFFIIAQAISKTRTLKILSSSCKSLDVLENEGNLAIFLQALQENDSITTMSLFSLCGSAKEANIDSLLKTFSLMPKLEQLKRVSTEDFSDKNLLSLMHIDHIKTIKFSGPIKDHQRDLIAKTFLESQKDKIWDMNLCVRAKVFLVQAVTKIMTEESYAIDTKIAPEYFFIIAQAISKTRTLKTLNYDYKSLDDLENEGNLAIFLQALQENDSIATTSLFSLCGSAKEANIDSLLKTFSLMPKLEQLKSVSTEDFSDINLLSLMHIDNIKTLRFLGPITDHQRDLIAKTFVSNNVGDSYTKAFLPPSLDWYVSYRQGDIPLDDWKTLVRLYDIVDPRYTDSKRLLTEESVTEYIGQSRLPFFDDKIIPQDITDMVGDFLKLSDVKLNDTSFQAIVTSNIIKANPEVFTGDQIAEAARVLSPGSHETPSAAAPDDSSDDDSSPPASSSASSSSDDSSDDDSTPPASSSALSSSDDSSDDDSPLPASSNQDSSKPEVPSAAAEDNSSDNNNALHLLPCSSTASNNDDTKMLTDSASSNPTASVSHDYGLDAINLIESYHSVQYIFDKLLGISVEFVTISPEVRSVCYFAASYLYYSSKDLGPVATDMLPIFVGGAYYGKEKLYDSISFNQDMNPVIKCGIYNAVMLGAKSPLYYGLISNPVTSSYGVKILLSDVVYSSATCMNIYFNTENEGSTESDMLSILMSGMIAYSALDFSTNIFSNALLAINSFASTHMMLNTIKDSGMHAIQGLTNYFASEEQTDFA